MVFTTWRLASCTKPELILWLWEKIRKSKCVWVRFSRSDVTGVQRAIRGSWSLVLPSVAEHHCVSTDTLRFSNFLPKSQNQLRLCARCQPPGYETPFGWAVHLKMVARVWIFDIRTNGNMLKILMCNITDIQPDDLSEVSSAMLHYINHFVN